MTDHPIYLDHNATTPVDRRVLEHMLPYFREAFGNAASRQHEPGQAARQAVEAAREQAAELIGAEPRDVVFTSGATESNNLAIKGAAAWYGRARGKGGPGADQGRHIVTASTEHKAVLEVCERLEAEGYKVSYVDPTAEGIVTAEAVAEAMRDDTILVSVMWANNEIGTINDVPGIGALCKERGVLFHCDATQQVGKLPVNVDEAGVDLMSFSAHKIYGPKGVGALYTRRKRPRARLVPLIDGGGHERGFRSGTLNVPGIVGLGKACELCAAEIGADAERLRALRDRLEQGLIERVPGTRINGHRERRLPHTTNVSFPGVDAEQLIRAVPGVAISSAAACTSSAAGPSHVLRRLGFGEERARGSVRFGLGRETTAEEIERAIEQVAEAVTTRDLTASSCDTGW